ncbi:MAG: PKD domain-containing protein [Candidatus Bipolaricaulota bacterium]|nr:PKD domain-containing protein [Candidatus Bipolaricaulota bacterium]
MRAEKAPQRLDLGRLRLHGLAVLAGLALLGGLLFPWSNFVQLVFQHKILTGVFFVLALLALKLSGYLLIRAMCERAVTLPEALAPLFYSATGVLSFVFGYFYILLVNPIATVYLLGAVTLAVGTLLLWPQSPQIRALLTGRAFRYSALGAITVTLVTAVALFSLGWAQRPISFHPPMAEFVVSSPMTKVGEPIEFDASSSKAHQSKIVRYDWDFGDGVWHEASAPQGAKVTHVYYEPGQYEVILRVTDERGEVSTAYSIFIHVESALEQGFEAPLSLPVPSAGMTWDGTRLWIIDQKQRVVYSQTESGWVIHPLPSEIQWPGGIEWDGQNFWLADNSTFSLYRLSPGSFAVLSRWEYPGTIPADLAWDGEYLWVIDEIDAALYAFEPRDGRTVRKLQLDPEVFPRPMGVAWDGLAFWVSDMHYGIRRVHPQNGALLGTMAAPEGGRYPIALAWDSGSQGYGRLLVADHDTRKLYPLRLRAWSPEKPRGGIGPTP